MDPYGPLVRAQVCDAFFYIFAISGSMLTKAEKTLEKTYVKVSFHVSPCICNVFVIFCYVFVSCIRQLFVSIWPNVVEVIENIEKPSVNSSSLCTRKTFR